MNRYIDADALKTNIDNSIFDVDDKEWYLTLLANAPHIDIVRCKECKHKDNCEQEVLLSEMYGEIEDSAHITFCSYGERREP